MARYSREHLVEVIEAMVSEGTPRTPRISEEIVVSDVQADARRFIRDSRLLIELGLPFPALSVDGTDSPIPVSLGSLNLTRMRAWPISFGRRRNFREVLSDEFERYGSVLSINEARSSFIRKAADFLFTRASFIEDDRLSISSGNGPQLRIRNRLGGSVVGTPGCVFQVTTNSLGLRVLWSGAYLITSNFFFSPTTPAKSTLQAGTYIFGVDGGAYGSNIQWDTNGVITLPGSKASTHLNY